MMVLFVCRVETNREGTRLREREIERRIQHFFLFFELFKLPAIDLILIATSLSNRVIISLCANAFFSFLLLSII